MPRRTPAPSWDDAMRAAVTVWLASHDETLNGLAKASGVQQPILYRWYHTGRDYSTDTLRLSDAEKVGRIVGMELRRSG